MGSSPRLVGEGSYLAGKGAKQVGRVTGLFPELDYTSMFNLLSKQKEEDQANPQMRGLLSGQ